MKFTGEKIVLDDRNSSLGTPIYQEHIERYHFAFNYTAGKRVLDVACGMGNGSALLSRNADFVSGLDRDKESVNFAKKHYSRPNSEFIIGDAEILNFPENSFDIVVSFETIEHLPSPKKFLKEIKKILKPGGMLILSSPDREVVREILIDVSYQNPFHIKEFSQEELKSLLEKTFQVEEIWGQFVYESSFLRKKIRDILRFLIQLDRQKRLKKLLPLSWVLTIPRRVSGMKKTVGPILLKVNQRAQINIFLCRKPNE